MIQLNVNLIQNFLRTDEFKRIQDQIPKIKSQLDLGQNGFKNHQGWVQLPDNISFNEIQKIEKIAEEFRKRSDVLVVIGIGGSFLGPKAVIDAFPLVHKKEVIFAGTNLDPENLILILNYLEKKDFTVNVISKSGTTIEPALSFRLITELLEKKYGRDSLSERVICTTDSKEGSLKQFADKYQIKTFEIPNDIGGRYSVLTPVGLFPIAYSGLNIQELLDGFKEESRILKSENDPDKNKACLYSSIRNLFYSMGKEIEVLASYSQSMSNLIEWWKQLFGESEGKDQKGLFPAGMIFTRDLHSLGQYLQEGKRNLFETVLNFQNIEDDLIIPFSEENTDGLNYLSSHKISELNNKARIATMIAHSEGSTPVFSIEIEKKSLNSIGALLYFFEYSCAISAILLGVNPYNQPGVEAYKKNMIALFGKEGMESVKENLLKKFF